MIMIRKLTVMLMLSGIGSATHAQKKDFGIWYSINIQNN